MDKSLKEKISGFLEWYRDLYGDELYIEDASLIFQLQNSLKSAMNDTAKSKSANSSSPLQKFNKEIENCTKCSLCESRTNFVFGAGNEHAEIMFVGEAPGQDEDLQGIPFVGRAGKLLTELLNAVQLKRSDVYIANILKCRPPNNRDPLPEEVGKCIPYLHRQISLIQPKLLVAVGRVAAQNLLNNQMSLSEMRRKIWQYRSMPLIVTYHPAYILRNMNMYEKAVEDMEYIIDYYKNAFTH